MKAILGLVCLTACVVFATCLSCRKAEDCKKLNKEQDKDEFCCMAGDILALEGKGLCLRLSRPGQKCHKEDAKVDYYGDKYIRYCPCNADSECEEKVAKNFTDPATTRANLKCKAKPPTVAPPDTEE